MSPEYGSTVAIFPIDEETLRYLRLTGRTERAGRAGRGLRQGAGPVARPDARAGLLRVPRARPRHGRPVARRPEAPAGPGDPGRARRRRSAEALPTYTDEPAATATLRLDGAGGHDRPRRRHDRRDHLVHQHLQPVGDARRRAAGEEGGREGPDPQAVGEDHAGAGLEGRHRLLREGRASRPTSRSSASTSSATAAPPASATPARCPRRSARRSTTTTSPSVSVLSGNRNFEGRINPDIKMNYLASPPLVVAYALAGTMDIDIVTEPLGTGTDGKPVYLRDIWPTAAEVQRRSSQLRSTRTCSPRATPTCSPATSAGSRCRRRRATRSPGTPTRPTCASPRTSTACRATPAPVTDIAGARVLAKLGDSVTTDHISPAGIDQGRQPGGHVPRRARRRAQGLQLLRLAPRQPRGDDPRHVRQHPAAQPAARTASRAATPATSPRPARRRRTIYDAAQAYAAAGMPLVILAGKEYGSGSSRDWAAKGTALLGVKAVIAESYERIHRSNLIGMGVLPLQFPAGETADSLGLDGTETFSVTGVTALNEGARRATVEVEATTADGVRRRVRRRRAHRHPRRGRLLPQRRHPAVRAAVAAGVVTAAPPGWPADLPPVGAGLDAAVVGWLLDRLPPEYRTSPVRRHPLILAIAARRHAEATVAGTREVYRELRAALRDHLEAGEIDAGLRRAGGSGGAVRPDPARSGHGGAGVARSRLEAAVVTTGPTTRHRGAHPGDRRTLERCPCSRESATRPT